MRWWTVAENPIFTLLKNRVAELERTEDRVNSIEAALADENEDALKFLYLNDPLVAALMDAGGEVVLAGLRALEANA